MAGKFDKKKSSDKNTSVTKKTLLIALCIGLSLILIVLLVAAFWLMPKLGLIKRTNGGETMSSSEYEEFLKRQQATADATGEEMDPASIVWGNNPDMIKLNKNSFNILLIGQDRREGEGRQRSDAMILCTFNIDKKTLTMTSFMRDLYVRIPGYNDNRINACYEIGGMKLLDKCLAQNFGVQVDKNVEIDFFGFIDVIDLIGGIDIELTRSEANYLNRRGNWDVDNASAGTWHLTEGVNHLTGEQALAYSRIRYIGNSDFERTERQRRVLTTLIESSRDLSASQVDRLLTQVLGMITTDMNPYTEVPAYALKIYPILKELKVVTQRVPADGAFYDANIRGMSVLVPDIEKNVEMLKQSMTE